MDDFVWVSAADGEPAWAVDGTYMVVRRIRMRVEFWDRTALHTQEAIIGRFKDTGAPLDGVFETDVPDLRVGSRGREHAADRAHPARESPHRRDRAATASCAEGSTSRRASRPTASSTKGLLFVCFQRSLADGFLAVQGRLNGEALEEYIRPVGGGFFFALPGVTTPDGYLGESLWLTGPSSTVDVRFPPARRDAACDHHAAVTPTGDRRLRALLPGRAEPRRPVRRLVLHRGHVDGHLLPPELPGDDAEARERALLSHGGRRAVGRLPRLPAVPARRHSRVAGVERARRPRRPGDAADRRRRRRPRGRRGARSPARVQRAPPQPSAHRGGRRGTDRARPSAAGPERARAHRDDRAARSRTSRSRPGSRASASSTTRSVQVFATTPSDLRAARRAVTSRRPEPSSLRLPVPGRRSTATRVLEFLAARASPASRRSIGATYRRALRLPHGAGVAELTPQPDHVRARAPARRPSRPHDGRAAVPASCSISMPIRKRSPSSSAPIRISVASVAKTPGLRLPGTVDGFELATRAVLGQQVSSPPPAPSPLGSSPARHAAGDPGRRAHPPVPAGRGRRELAPGSARDAGSAKGGARPHSRPPSRTTRSSSMRAPTVPRRPPACSTSAASARGPLRTSRCVASVIPTSSFRPTSVCDTRSNESDQPTSVNERGRARRALAPVAFVRRHAPLEVAGMKTATATTWRPLAVRSRSRWADDAVIASGWTTSIDELMQPVPSALRPTTITSRRERRRGDRGGSALLRGRPPRDRRHRSGAALGAVHRARMGACCAPSLRARRSATPSSRRRSVGPTQSAPRRTPVPSTPPRCSCRVTASCEPEERSAASAGV